MNVSLSHCAECGEAFLDQKNFLSIFDTDLCVMCACIYDQGTTYVKENCAPNTSFMYAHLRHDFQY